MSRRPREATEEDSKESAGPKVPPKSITNDKSAATLLTFVTSNAGKLSEVNAMLKGNTKVQVECHALDLAELQGTPREVACEKAKAAFKILGKPCMVEDTSLCYCALGDGNLPGPYIRDFLRHLGHDGLNRILVGFDDKSAYAQCIFAVAFSEDEIHLFEGRCYGHIVPSRGGTGFGWDPIFEPTEGGKENHKRGEQTFAQMSKDEKNQISHRRRALDQLVEFLSAL